jgi:hypothetical protein
MRSVVRIVSASAAVTVIGVLGMASSANADLITSCIGTGGAVTVPNDLVVPANESCALTGTTVTGNVSVAAGANLVVTGGHFSGSVTVAGNGYLDATDTTIGGAVVVNAGGYGTYLRNTQSGSLTVRPKGATTIDSFLFVEKSKIAGGVTANAGEVRLDVTTEVTGSVNSTGSYYTDVHDSFIDGQLSVLNSATGSVVCGSAVKGKATFAGNLGGVQLGPNGTLDGCAAGGYFGKDVSITNTTGNVTVDDNIIDGALTVSANTPAATVAANNRIRGGVVGERATAAARAKAAPKALAGNRENAGEQRAQVRASSAVQEATAAGDAGL